MKAGRVVMGAQEAKRAILAVFCLILGVCALKGEEAPQVLTAGPWSGVDTFHAPNTLAPDMVKDASNILFDEGLRAKQREGFSIFLTLPTSAPVRGAWSYTAQDGTEWVVLLSSHQLYGYNNSTTTLLLSGLDPDNDMDCAPGNGNLYCTDRSTDVFYFNGTSVSYVTNAPKGSLIEWWRNRLVLADVSGAQSQLFLSGQIGDASGGVTDWTVGARSTSPVVWPLGGVNDGGNRIRGLTCGPFDFCQVFTDRDMYGFFGYDQRDFSMNKLYDGAGCIADKTIRQHQGVLRWLSRNGVEGFDRNVLQFPRISEDIRDQIEDVIALGGDELNWVQTTQADFAAGTHAETSDSLSPGSVVLATLATWTATDTSGSDFGAGTLTNVTTQTVSGSLHLSVANANLNNNSFEDALGSEWTVTVGSGKNICAPPCPDGSWHFESWQKSVAGSPGVNWYITYSVLDENDAILYSNTTPALADSAWTQYTISYTFQQGQAYKIRLTNAAGTGVSAGEILDITSELFYGSGQTGLTFYAQYNQTGFQPPNIYKFRMYIDYLQGGKSSITSGTFLSRTFDTAVTSPAWMASGANWSANGHNITAETQSSTDSTNWSSLVAWSTGSYPTSPFGRYMRYKLTLTLQSSGTALPYIEDVTFSARSATGAYTSQIKDRGAVTVNGHFEANYILDGGSMTFWVRTATSAAMVLSQPWTQQTPFTTMAGSTDPFFQAQTRFQIYAATQNPTLYDFTDFWNTGGVRPTMPAEVYRDRYHLFYTTSSEADARNTKVALIQRNGKWTFFDGITGASACLYRNKFLVGDSQATGRVFQLYSGHDDAGAEIETLLRLKDYDGGDEDAEKKFEYLFLTADHAEEEGQDINLDVSYTVDGATTSYSLGTVNLAETPGRIVAQVPFPADGSVSRIGRWIGPVISHSGAGEPFSLYGLRIYWKPLPKPWEAE